MKKKHRKRTNKKLWIFQYRRYKWSRRGSNIVHFVLGFSFTFLGYLIKCIIFIGKSLADFVRIIFKKTTKRKQKVKIKAISKVEVNNSRFKAEAERPEVTFDDIYGLEEVKREIRLRVIEPLKHPEIAKAYNLAVGGAIMLSGPPGNGKTEIARAIANEVDASFFLFEIGKILGSSGDSERNCGAFFNEVRKNPKALVFVDEAEGAFPSRVKNTSTVRVGLTTQFLREIDGFRKNVSPGGFLILISATNHLKLVDEAALSRHGIKIHVPKVDENGRMFIIKRELNSCPCDLDNAGFEEVVEITKNCSGRDVVEVVKTARLRSFERAISNDSDSKVLPVNLSDFVKAIAVVAG